MSKSQNGPGFGKYKKAIRQIPGGILKKVFLYGMPALTAILVIAVVATYIFADPNHKGTYFGKIKQKNQQKQQIEVKEEISPLDKVEKNEVRYAEKDITRINRDFPATALKDLKLPAETEKSEENRTVDINEIKTEQKTSEVKEIIKPNANASTVKAPQPTETAASDEQEALAPQEPSQTDPGDISEEQNAPAQGEGTAEQNTDTEDDAVETWVNKYVNTEVLNIRISPAFDSEVIGTLTQGDLVTEVFVVNNSEWSNVQLANGSEGYVYNYYLTTDYVEPLPEVVEEKAVEESAFEEVSGTLYIAVGAANVRSEATVSSDIVTTLYYGNSIDYSAYADGWYKVNTAGGQSGYIREDLLRDTPVPQEELDALENVAEPQPEESVPAEPEPAPSPEPIAPGNSGGVAAVNIALAQVGKPYVYGTAGPNTFDCSGLVQYAVINAGGSISRSSYTQACDGIAVPFSAGDYSQLAPGDVLCFAFGGGVSHVGMYVGDGQFVHAMNPSDGIQVNNLNGYWGNSLAYVRRIFY